MIEVGGGGLSRRIEVTIVEEKFLRYQMYFSALGKGVGWWSSTVQNRRKMPNQYSRYSAMLSATHAFKMKTYRNSATIAFAFLMATGASMFAQTPAPAPQTLNQTPSNPIEQLFNLIYWSSIAQIVTTIISLLILNRLVVILRRISGIAEEMRKANGSK